MNKKIHSYTVRISSGWNAGSTSSEVLADGVAIKDNAAVFYKSIPIRGGRGKRRIEVMALFPLSQVHSIVRSDI